MNITKMNINIIYHADCLDGWMAAYLLRYILLKTHIGLTFTFYPMHYQTPTPNLSENDILYIVDFSLSKDELDKLALTREVFLLDHHKSSADKLGGWGIQCFDNLSITIINERSACCIVLDMWYYSNPYNDVLLRDKIDLPDRLINMCEAIGDRDLWQWKLPNSLVLTTIMSATPKTIEAWDEVLLHETDLEFSNRELQAKYYIQYEIEHANFMANKVQLIKFQGLDMPIVNVSNNISNVGNTICKKYPMSMSYFITGLTVVVSMRSKSPEYDVSELCKKYGGGGHLSASGFKIPVSKLEDLLLGKL